MKQLAEMVGLDISTVSRALRGDRKRVAASTIERVQRMAKETGFVADPRAVGLRSGRSRLVGVVVTSLTDIVMGMLVTAIDEATRDLGYVSTVVATHDDPQARSQAVARLLGRRVDGLILCDSAMGREVPEQLADSSAPFVFAMRRCDTETSVTADDRHGGALVARHFLDSGHRVVAVVPGPAHARTVADRVAGFQEALAGHADVTVLPPSVPGGFQVEDGYRSANALLEHSPRPSAIFCTNDHAAIGAVRAVTEHGLRVGRDIALVGYNDIPQVAYLETSLTSVRTDIPLMGRTAAEQLIRIADGGTGTSLEIAPTLVVRESSDPAVFEHR